MISLLQQHSPNNNNNKSILKLSVLERTSKLFLCLFLLVDNFSYRFNYPPNFIHYIDFAAAKVSYFFQ